MKPKFVTIFSLLALSCSINFSSAQSIEEQLTKSQPDCRSVFVNAMNVLPRLYRVASFDSMSKAVDIWQSSCGDVAEVKFTKMLLEIQTEKFTVSGSLDESSINILNEYAKLFPSDQQWRDPDFYGDPEILFFKMSASWASVLLKNKKLDENEKFLCKVLTGEIKNPEQEITANSQTYPELAALYETNFQNRREQVNMYLGLGTGVWVPTNNLKALGVHPSFTFQIGVRNLRHELDVTIQLRYLNSPNVYIVNKHGAWDTTDYYVGYYVGLDYTYYFVSKKKYEFGVEAGMGYDAFAFAESPYYYDNYYDEYYDPHYSGDTEIGSFNANAGLRFNYFVSHKFYVGLLSRYNAIHYPTHGGTNLSGDAISIDLIFGFHGAKSNR